MNNAMPPGTEFTSPHPPLPGRRASGTATRSGVAAHLIFSSLAAGLVASFLFLSGCNPASGSGEEASIRALVVRTEPAEPREAYNRQQSFLGSVENRRTSRVGFDLGGTVTNILVREGETVLAEQELARLDTSRLEAAFQEAEAGLEEAEASAALAKTTLERVEQASKLNAVSTQQLDEARQNLLVRKATVARTRAQIERIRIDIQKSVLRAPYTGEVRTRMIDEGTVIRPGQPILEIAESGTLEIRVGLDRENTIGVGPGDRLTAHSRGRSFPVRLDRIIPGRNPRTRTIEIILQPTPPPPDLREGDLVEIIIPASLQTAGYWLPVSALTENSRGLWSCYVAEPLEEDQKVGAATHEISRRELEIVSLRDETVYVAGSLNPGELVVLDGIHRLVPGQRVQLSP